MEPGFRASYASTKAWLQGYLRRDERAVRVHRVRRRVRVDATTGGCNNGWTMAGLYYLTGGADPIRMINLPQIYNTTMAAAVALHLADRRGDGQPKINFGGALTEWTACRQAQQLRQPDRQQRLASDVVAAARRARG